MTDRPTTEDILTAVREWLERSVAPALQSSPPLRFQTLIAAHLLGAASQNLARDAGEMRQRREERLTEKRALVEKIRRGDYDGREEMLVLLRKQLSDEPKA